MPARLASLAAPFLVAFALAGCDSQPPEGSTVGDAPDVVGVWTVADVRYQEFITPTRDLQVLSPYAPAGGGIAVPGAAPLRFVLGTKTFGSECAAAPCFDLYAFGNTARNFLNRVVGESPSGTEYLLQIDGDGGAVLYDQSPSSSGNYFGQERVTVDVTSTTITVPAMTVQRGDEVIELPGARFDLPVTAFARGVEAPVMEPLALDSPLTGGTTITFSEGGTVRFEWPDGGAATGAWSATNGELTVTRPGVTYRGDLDGALSLTSSEACAANPCLTAATGKLLLPNGSLASFRMAETLVLRRTDPT